MTGQVRYINGACSMVAVQTEDGYSILELLGDEVEIGDELRWRGTTPLGGEAIRNVTRGADMDVIFQVHHVPWSELRAQLFV